jgi:AcrR family transcriptional regulator
MKQEERSARSQAAIRAAALRLFSTQGFRGTNLRQIAEEAGVSTGAVYHQFRDKDELFGVLLDEYWQAISSPDLPINRALASGAFPDRLVELGQAARDTVERYRPYIALIYVDVVEFEGHHIRRFYADMAQRFGQFIEARRDELGLDEKLRPGVSPVSAIMLASRVLLYYYSVEILFGVRDHFGKDSDAAMREIADILQYGILRPVSPSPV